MCSVGGPPGMWLRTTVTHEKRPVFSPLFLFRYQTFSHLSHDFI